LLKDFRLNTTPNKKYKFAPSLLAANQSEIANEVKRVPNADWFHVDVMDNHFAPNMGFSADALKSIAALKQAPIDAHLMIENPENFLETFIKAGADSLTIHAEATREIDKCIDIVKESNKRIGIALKPDTPFSDIKKYLTKIDMVLIMTVYPGYSGQVFLHNQVEKIREVRSEIDKSKLDIWLQIDGGVGLETLEIGLDAGADFFVVGSSVYYEKDPESALNNLKQLITKNKRS
jgi:ribulose-phosphate 3-epimerase